VHLHTWRGLARRRDSVLGLTPTKEKSNVKRLIVPAGAILALTPGIAAAATGAHAIGKPPTPAHARAYERVYHEVAHRFGRRTPGRNIVKDGVSSHRRASDAEVVASITVLRRMLAPAPTTTTTAATTTATAPVSSSAPVSTGGGGVPACASESGTNYSTGPDNTNPSSGATGRYQILPSTAAAYGCNLSTPGGQDACAQTIYANQGSGAWVGCGG
jgi:hypothetical protein